MRARVVECHLESVRPLATARGVVTWRRVWVLVLTDETGRTGLGEAAPFPGFGGEDPLVCATALDAAADACHAGRFDGWLEQGDPLAELGVASDAPCARAALEGALLDLLAQRRGVPLARLLAAAACDTIGVSALDDGTPGSLARAAAEGFRTVKLKAATPQAALARVASARREAPELALRIDANASWSLAEAVPVIDAAGAQLDYLEQPLPAGDLTGAALLRRRGVRLAADEAVRCVTDLAALAAAGAADVAILKPGFLGGWAPTVAMAGEARRLGLDVVITSVLDGAIGRAHASHAAAALGLDAVAHGLASGALFVNDLTSEPLSPVHGRIALRDRPGLGIGALR